MGTKKTDVQAMSDQLKEVANTATFDCVQNLHNTQARLIIYLVGKVDALLTVVEALKADVAALKAAAKKKAK